MSFYVDPVFSAKFSPPHFNVPLGHDLVALDYSWMYLQLAVDGKHESLWSEHRHPQNVSDLLRDTVRKPARLTSSETYRRSVAVDRECLEPLPRTARRTVEVLPPGGRVTSHGRVFLHYAIANHSTAPES